MIYFTMFLLGGIFGIALWFYLSGFITRLQQEIYATYIELFPQNFLPFQPSVSSIQQKKVRSYFEVFFKCWGRIYIFTNCFQGLYFRYMARAHTSYPLGN